MSADPRVIAQSVALLFQQARTTVVASMFLVGVLLWRGWPFPLWQQAVWAVLVLGISLLRFRAAHRYLKLEPELQVRDASGGTGTRCSARSLRGRPGRLASRRA